MGFRLSKIYTKTGDKKYTSTATNQRLLKDHPKIILSGQLDELNCTVGLIVSFLTNEQVDEKELLLDIQHQLFDFGAQITLPEYEKISEASVSFLEAHIDKINASLPNLKEFILPGGNQAASFCHLARSKARSCECSVITLSRYEVLNEVLFSYINRLSDLLFVLARLLNISQGSAETYWKSRRLENSN
ncbi:cob(I)yrinic acid a,c-diamide adenosyltransferase [Thiotrichales bacterium 19S9-12]|nr:cob(I)yrinic acid a,c-diamide adenosyltransferase [Thiotrichales bacterium 19S9-11]MCF6811355.1 cob(I)yrinic acid a,c-diamide adenosyltransferase [Thiotrichales bacterium 19S9-12]